VTHPETLTLDHLRRAVEGSAVAVRRRLRLVPAGGEGDKVFPPTYEGSLYASEERVVDGRRVPCALLDSVQSQANRMEQALKQACYRGPGHEAEIPVVTVDFAAVGLPEVGEVTSLDAPHRLADAILRDSVEGKTPFRSTPAGKVLDTASVADATGLYGACPTALVFGLWDSTGPRGGLGVKFQRAIVGEIVAFDVTTGVRPSSRIDPLGIERNAGPVYAAADGTGWTLDPSKARTEKGKPVKYGKDGKPSEINHGNVTPSLESEAGVPHHGGVTLGFALHSVVLSLPALRRLRFPAPGGGGNDTDRDVAARTALAALALAGASLSIAQGCDLRSRCLLVPDAAAPTAWELVAGDGKATAVEIPDALGLLRAASQAAQAAGLPAWRGSPVRLVPGDGLADLVRKSRELKAQGTAEA
jgi:CRISPR-associated protein Csb1